jgi:hypothetical protein
MDFKIFGTAVAAQFKKMTEHTLYRTTVTKDELWDTYLASFPEGTNPIYKERTEHDCQCCKSFIRAVGGVVAIIDGKVVSIWDVDVPGFYGVVARRMASLIDHAQIDNLFLHTEPVAGTAKTQQLLEDLKTKSWDHFFVNLPKPVVVRGEEIGPKLSEARAAKDVMLRGLVELTTESIETTIDLIKQNSLERGQEHLHSVEGFQKLKAEFLKIPADDVQARDIFCWSRIGMPANVSRIRNTSIGTFLIDLSEDVDLEVAVVKFGKVMSPNNYKRPTSLVTPAMIKSAQAKVEELGYLSALPRRFATIDDIQIPDILFANRTAKKSMNVFEDLAAKTPVKMKKTDHVEEVSIDKFLADILPRANSLELFFENRHANNLVSLIAPEDPTAKIFTKWDNNFTWSYNGDVADSIKERVKAAGGSVVGDLCCRLAWEYTDDLDFHMIEPNGYQIYYGNRYTASPCKGHLDVDANGGSGMMDHPVENIFYGDKTYMREGTYTLVVHNFNRRSSGIGFEVEIEFGGQTIHVVYDKVIKDGQKITVAEIAYSKKNGFTIVNSLPSTKVSKTVWNVPTETFQKVNVVMNSPNYWGEKGTGNRHVFFMLENCLRDGQARGFYNEQLTGELDAHRKVFEIVGAKMKTEQSDRQLSGLGFSSTKRDNILVRVTGALDRMVRVTF